MLKAIARHGRYFWGLSVRGRGKWAVGVAVVVVMSGAQLRQRQKSISVLTKVRHKCEWEMGKEKGGTERE